MSYDKTESYRRNRTNEINSDEETNNRAALEAKYGQVWDTDEMQEDFQPMGFMAPYLVCTRKADGVVGSLEFRHYPRFYFSFTPDSK